MRKFVIRRLPILLLLVMLVTACDFGQPLAKPGARLDPQVLGSWISVDKGETMHVLIGAASKDTYVGRMWHEDERGKPCNFVAWPVNIAGKTFWTIDLGAKASKRFLYAQITVLDKDNIEYRKVNADSTAAKGKPGLTVEAVRGALRNPELLLPPTRFTRAH